MRPLMALVLLAVAACASPVYVYVCQPMQNERGERALVCVPHRQQGG